MAAVGHHADFVAVAPTTMIRSPAALGAGTDHTGRDDVGLAIIRTGSRNGAGEDQEGKQCFHDVVLIGFTGRDCRVHEANRWMEKFDCEKVKKLFGEPVRSFVCGS